MCVRYQLTNKMILENVNLSKRNTAFITKSAEDRGNYRGRQLFNQNGIDYSTTTQ